MQRPSSPSRNDGVDLIDEQYGWRIGLSICKRNSQFRLSCLPCYRLSTIDTLQEATQV